MKKNVFSRGMIPLLMFYFCGVARAGVGTSIMQTAGVKAPGDFEAKAQADIVFDSELDGQGKSGFNISPHLITGLIEHYLDIDAYFGTGTTDFQIGALAKYNLLPDIDGQLGLSFLGGLSYLRDAVGADTQTGLLVTLGILTSKTLHEDFGNLTPYGGYEFEILSRSQGNAYPSSLILGAKWEPAATKPWAFYSEVTLNIHSSIYAVSLGASQSF